MVTKLWSTVAGVAEIVSRNVREMSDFVSVAVAMAVSAAAAEDYDDISFLVVFLAVDYDDGHSATMPAISMSTSMAVSAAATTNDDYVLLLGIVHTETRKQQRSDHQTQTHNVVTMMPNFARMKRSRWIKN